MPILTLIALIALAIIMTLLLAPVRVRFRIDDIEQYAAMGYLGFNLRIGNPDQHWELTFLSFKLVSGILSAPTRRKPALKKKKSPKERSPIAIGDLWSLLSEYWPTLRRTLFLIIRLVGRLLRSWRLETGHIKIKYGTGDPGSTGILTGYLYAIQGWLTGIRPALEIRIQPEFDQRVMNLTGSLTLRIIPLTPIWHFIQTLGTIPWRGLWKLKRAWAEH